MAKKYRLTYTFRVEIDGIQVGGFDKVSGLGLDFTTNTFYEGGSPDPYVFPGRNKPKDVTLSKGVEIESELWEWVKEHKNGEDAIRNLSIYYTDRVGNDLFRYDLTGCTPKDYTGGDLNANEESVLLETLVISVTDIDRVRV